MTVDRVLITKAILGLLALVGLGMACALVFNEQITSVGTLFIERFGLLGVGVATLITDSSPIPLTSEPVALLAMGAEIPFWSLVVVMAAGSHLGCLVGYAGGYWLGSSGWLLNILDRKLPELMQAGPKYAIKMVALGASLPIPYALTTWAAGMLKADLKLVILASSLRWIKTLITLSLLQGSWNIGVS